MTTATSCHMTIPTNCTRLYAPEELWKEKRKAKVLCVCLAERGSKRRPDTTSHIPNRWSSSPLAASSPGENRICRVPHLVMQIIVYIPGGTNCGHPGSNHFPYWCLLRTWRSQETQQLIKWLYLSKITLYKRVIRLKIIRHLFQISEMYEFTSISIFFYGSRKF